MSGKKYIFREDLEPLLEGVSVLGTGGGGSPLLGRKIMLNDYKRGRKYQIIDPHEIEDDSLVVSGGIMGSVKTLDNLNFNNLLDYWEENFELEKAFIEMEKELGKKIDYLVPFEMGGLNTIVILSLGSRLGIPVINGDPLGRAAPETQMTSFIGHNISLTPMPLVDHVGNIVIVRDTVNPVYPDQIGRYIVTNGGGLGANNHYPMSGKQLKESVIPKTITKAINIGKNIIQSRKTNKDPVRVLVNLLSGEIIFHGKVDNIIENNDQGFYFTKIKMNGIGKFNNKECQFIIKNETMACWINNELKIMFPDLLCMINPELGSGILSTQLKEGLQIKLMAIPCHQKLREAIKNPLGKAAFSSERYGQNIEYIPFEEL